LPARIAALEAACAADDGDAIRAIAHALRGSGATYGFPSVTAAAGAVESASADELMARTLDLIAVLRGVITDSEDSEAVPAIRVLLVDDDPEIRLIVSHLLTSAGYVVDEAEDSRSAAAALSAAVPDVVLMDVMLGSENGVETAAALFRSIAGPPPRLIFLTGAVLAEQFERMNASGAAGIIHKPFDPDSFLSLFERMVGFPL
jgi:CheY-like chemotaxis protein